MTEKASAPADVADGAPIKPVKYFEDQFDDEEVLYLFRKHPVMMRMGLIWSSLALLVGPVAILALTYLRPDDPPSIAMFFMSLVASFVLSAIVFLPSWIEWHFSVYIVTDQRLIQIKQKGLFHRSVVDMGLRQIQMVNYEINGMQESMLGFGTIMMQTLVGDLVIHEVHHPDKTAKKIQMILRDYAGNTASAGAATYEVPDNQLQEELYEAED